MKEQSSMQIKVLSGFQRHDVVSFLSGSNNLGIELGVAEGIFSERMLSSQKFLKFFGVDSYEGSHDTAQYKRALKRTEALYSSYVLFRMRFEEALDIFPDEYFDFIYVDGFAHSGEEGGETICQWYSKLKIGGVMAGDDYDKKWPLVISAVNDFVRKTGSELMITEIVEKDNSYSMYPSWVVIKKDICPDLSPSKELVKQGKIQANKIAKRRASSIRLMIRRLTPRILRTRLGRIAEFFGLQ